jgi:hypothetical protein
MRIPRRVVGRLAVGLVAAATLFAPTTAGATPASGEVAAVGWWTSRPGAAPSQNGGFEVALNPDGSAQSVAALQVDIDKLQMSRLTLTLTETASVGAEFAHLRVCPAASGWPPANPGALTDAPKIDCASAFVDLVHSGSSWQGSLVKLFPNGGGGSIGVVGVRDGDTPVGFLVEVSGVTIVGEGTLPADEARSDDSSATPTSEPTGAAFVDQYLATPDSTPSVFTSDPATSVALPSNKGDEPTVGGPAALAVTGAVHSTGPNRPWVRLLWLTPLSAALGAGVVFGRRILTERGIG